MANFAGYSDFDVDAQEIEQRRKYAEMLRQQSMEPVQSQMAGGYVVPVSPLQGLAKMLQAYSGRKGMETADADKRALAEALRGERMGTLERFQGAMEGRPEEQGTDPTGGLTVNPAQAPNPKAAMMALALSRDPQMSQMGVQGYMKQMTPDNVVVGRSLLNRNTGSVVGQDATWKGEQEAAREARAQEIQMKLADARTQAQERAALQRELAQMRIDGQREMRTLAAGLRPPQTPVAVMGPDGKPVYVSPDQAVGRQPAGKEAAKLPTSALKMQQEELDAIGLASSISADVNAMRKQIESGQLKLGPVENLFSKGKNFTGMSDKNSQNFATFQATLEKMRNDSLRLNKGVQTEGDAQRAWNELVSNINDPKVVAKRLAEIEQINNRAVNIRKMNLDAIRSNFGMESMDTAPMTNQPPAVGGQWKGQERRAAPSGFKILGAE